MENHTFENVSTIPSGHKPVGRFVFDIKRNLDGSIARYKARLVAQGFTQREGIDYEGTFAPVIKLASLRLLFAIVAQLDLDVDHIDIETAFLNGELDKEIYMKAPLGSSSEKLGMDLGEFWRFKSIYGLKQASRIWYQTLDEVFKEFGLERIHSDFCIYVLRRGNKIIFLGVYVDDMLLASNCPTLTAECKAWLGGKFKLKDLGSAKHVLGLEVIRDRNNRIVELSQSHYIDQLATRFGLENARTAATPLSSGFVLRVDDCPSSVTEKQDMEGVPYQSIVGALMYAMTATGQANSQLPSRN